MLGQNSHFSSKSMKTYYKKSHTVESQLPWKVYLGYGLSMLFVCCQFVLQVHDELQCLAKQLNPSLGQMESRSHSVDRFGCRSPAASLQSHAELGCASELEAMEQCVSSAVLAGLTVCFYIMCSSSGKSSFRNLALQLHRDGHGMVLHRSLYGYHLSGY